MKPTAIGRRAFVGHGVAAGATLALAPWRSQETGRRVSLTSTFPWPVVS